MKRTVSFVLALVIALIGVSTSAIAAPPENKGYFVIKIYHYTTGRQEAVIDSFLQNQFVPYLHSTDINNVGIFKAIANDTAADKKIYILIPFKNLKQWERYSLDKKMMDLANGSDAYNSAPYNNPAYTRIETILTRAFKFSEPMAPSKLTSARSERVYELRSYESGSERIFRTKVKMFNEGGEINIFKKLGFNAVFYSEVVFGSKMPNLMYMTSFENMQSRMDHWKAFSADPDWKKLSSEKEYLNAVQHSDIYFLRATNYSDL